MLCKEGDDGRGMFDFLKPKKKEDDDEKE